MLAKRKGHPLRDRVARGEVTLIDPLDIPDREAKLAALSPEEREIVSKIIFQQMSVTKKSLGK